MKKMITLAVACCFLSMLAAQKDFYKTYTFTQADTLRGMLRPERSCYDVTFYDLSVKVDVDKRYLSGYVDIFYKAKTDFNRLQIDLFANMQLDRIVFQNKELKFERVENAVFVTFPKQRSGTQGNFRVYYQGAPNTAQNPPWDGGFVWATDDKGNPWVGVACEGDGASLWWPCKDHLSDEPDSMSIRVEVPNGLTCVANGNLRGTYRIGEYTRYDWFVSYPINNYNVSVNIAKYAYFSSVYTAKDGQKLPLDYYVIPSNIRKAKEHFKQVEQVLACYEHYFDKYPFWKDGFALVETPYLGMEHQSAIAYGNKYMRGYLGGMVPKGQDWDYIIVHETGHEYFGNSISCNDIAEMWIHESFTTYMEALYVEYTYGYKQAVDYLMSQRQYIYNQEPILGPKDVNWDDWESSDHYYKGAWILHTLRSTMQNDEQFFALLKGFYNKHKISNIRTEDFIQYVNEATGRNYTAFFEQYLQYPQVPTLLYELKNTDTGLEMSFKWEASVAGFDMPVLAGKADAYELIYPTTQWKTVHLKGLTAKEFRVPTELFYIQTKSK